MIRSKNIVFVVLSFKDMPNGRSTIAEKHFIANNETAVASVLYEAYISDAKPDIISVSTDYADGYDYYNVTHGEFRTGVTDNNETQHLDSFTIFRLFEDYKAGKAEPVFKKDAYACLHKPRTAAKSISISENEPIYNECDKDLYDFARYVAANTKKYPDDIVTMVKIIENEYFYGNDIASYPEQFQPKGLLIPGLYENEDRSRIAQVSSDPCSWLVSAEINGEIASTRIAFNAHGIFEYGVPAIAEFANKLCERYILTKINDAYYEYVSGKLQISTKLIKDIISHIVIPECLCDPTRTPYKERIKQDITVDDIIRKNRNATPEMISRCMDFYENNPDIIDYDYESADSFTRTFYDWFRYRKENDLPVIS